MEFRSLLVKEERARGYLLSLWREELFRETQAAVVFTDVEQTQDELQKLEKGRLRFVLSPRRLKPEERQKLYHGLEERNQVILLEPRDPKFEVLANRDLLKWAQRTLAAGDLAGTSQDAARKTEYERLAREDRKNILDALRRAGLIYLHPEGEGFEEESLGNSTTKEDVVNRMSQDIYPVQMLAEDLGQRLEEYKGRTIKDVDRDYRTLLGYPVPTHFNSVFKAVRLLCEDGKLGVRHQRGDFSGEDPPLTENELANATLDAPFARSQPLPLPTPGSPSPLPVPELSPDPVPAGGMPAPAPVRDQVTEIAVPAQLGPGALRQELAARLQALDGVRVSRVRFTLFLEKVAGDLSALPQGLRGSLSGSGTLIAEISIVKEAVGGKGEVEQLAERLPNIPDATYSARLEILLPAPAAQEG